MTRKRSPENDYICARCGCPCDWDRHLGGGSTNVRACGKPPRPILRSELESDAKAAVAEVRRLRARS